ncbi:hypothetical protein CC85DRAFT_284797 [Cutaneotrichosporon oleaginosum]|uniref:Uncharacterized protein n=1 Tax=Cutaneotrichosporon oleaginosum TaxID=879819 RepID=A0A0J0XQ46_9TREE|nr:uncharacterized protein CC85DRAFT_284797 [Cutaneotrichosporon oleaginosum]KLT43240.1 hypothetical protein CC85DRAFT_284797 [Cutaneotrichosporon oleaginosum]
MSSNQQQGQPGQFAQQGQYGAVTGGGFGGALAKDRDGNLLQGGQQQQQQQQQEQRSAYEGYGANDSSASGGFGRNAGGSSFSRANQMGVDSQGPQGSEQDSYNDYESGAKTGASTPGYRKDGEDDNLNSQFRGQNLAFSKKKEDEEPEI